MDNPSASLDILTKLGFCARHDNNNILIYKQPKGVSINIFLKIYCMTHISPKLFDLACNQLYLKMLKPNPAKIYSLDNGISKCISSINDTNIDGINTNNVNKKDVSGVFIVNPDSSNLQFNINKQLINQLLQLPNQHHCYSGTFDATNVKIWILNNNGKEYQNIDWNKMDLYQLINNLTSDFVNSISHCIQFCIDNDQIIFLKKVIYFLTKYLKKLNNISMTSAQITMMQVRKHNKILQNHPFFIEQIKQLCRKQYAICSNNGTVRDYITIVSNEVDKLVNDKIIPTLKSRSHLTKQNTQQNKDLLKRQKFWKCFVCQNNIVIEARDCTTCLKNHSLYIAKINGICRRLANPIIASKNPYHAFIENESTLFNIQKPFGILVHHQIQGQTKYIDFEFQNDKKSIINVICDLTYNRISIVFYSDNSLTIDELKTIMYELWSFTVPSGKCRELVESSFDFHGALFANLNDNDLVPQTRDMKPYYIDIRQQKMESHTRIRNQYKMHFGKKHCNYQCPFVIVAMKQLEKTSDLNPFIHCPYLSDNNEDHDLVLQHLSSYDHFDSFNIVQSQCPLQNNCSFLKNVSKNDNNYNTAKHLYLYRHNNIDSSKTIGKNIFTNTSFKFYDYIPQISSAQEIIQKSINTVHINLRCGKESILIAKLLHEIVRNGYIRDLSPEIGANDTVDDKYKKNILNQLESMINQCKQVDLNVPQRKALKVKFNKFFLNTFNIFQQLKTKMDHPRHKRIQSSLNNFQMLALMLYCNGDCNYDLCLSQRDGSYKTKWPIFDALVNHAIEILSQFEEHWENIYSGICGVFYEFKQEKINDYCTFDRIYFTTNVSFTTDLEIAKQFRGSSGMIIGLNMKRSYLVSCGYFKACDVSWISRYPHEKEILCSRGSPIYFYRNTMTVTQNKNTNEKQQWFVCDEGNAQETSFQAMFLGR